MSAPLSIAFLGPGAVGKSTLTVRLAQNVFIEVYDPTLEDVYMITRDIGGTHYVIALLDTAGCECDYDRFRESNLWKQDGYIIVYTISQMWSFREAEEFIQEEFPKREKLNPEDKAKAPMILVGNKCDLEDERQVSFEEGRALADKYGIPFIETSAKTGQNVEEMLETLIRDIGPSARNNDNSETKNKGCVIQ